VKSLKDERGACFKLREDAPDLRSAAEGRRPPGKAFRVRADVEFLTRFDQTKRWIAEASRAEKPLDVGNREEVVEASLLVARDDERLPLPVLGEELLRRDGLDCSL